MNSIMLHFSNLNTFPYIHSVLSIKKSLKVLHLKLHTDKGFRIVNVLSNFVPLLTLRYHYYSWKPNVNVDSNKLCFTIIF